jgi:tRNA nucleotidyltransferase/poly(A) polymerase
MIKEFKLFELLVQLKKAITLDNQIKLHGLEIGTKNYLKWKETQKIKNTLPYFIDKYGDDQGLEKWLQKNDKISISNSNINREDRKEFINYIIDVNKFTRLSLNMNTLIKIELRGLEHGYDLDHMVSKTDGFNNNVPSYVIGHISNLIIVDSTYNRRKRHRSDLEISFILDKYNKDIKYKDLVSKITTIKNNNMIKESNNEYNKMNAAYDFIKSQIKDTEWDNRVYAAGGYVRDELLGQVPKDLDLMIDKENGGIEFAEWLMKKLGIYRKGSNPVIYPRFGTAKFNLRGMKFNGYDLSELDIEAVMPRSEKYEDGSRKPDVEFSSLKKDSERRDLTVNSMFKNLTNDEILDLTGMGREDLKKGLVRSPIDPDIIFDEDPLRMMRVIRTTVKYNWKLPLFMIRSLKKNAKKLQNISSERIREELDKMLLTKTPDKAIRLLQILGLSKYIFPELDKLIKMKQNKFHKYDAMRHTLEVLKNTPPDLVTRLSALLHDIGKAKTKTENKYIKCDNCDKKIEI